MMGTVKHLYPNGAKTAYRYLRSIYRAIIMLYQIVLFLWFTRRILRWFIVYVYDYALSPLYRLTMNWKEKLSIIAFVMKWVLLVHRVAPRRFLPFLRRDTAIRLQGVKYVVGLEAGEIFPFLEIYRDHLYDRVADFVPQADWTVFDLGANVGVFAIQQARRGARVFAFEPNPDCYRRLSRTVVENGFETKVSALNYAVGSAPGLGTLHVPIGATVAGSVTPIERSSSVMTPAVTITALDDIVPTLRITRIDLLKIDTEGAEVEVLRGSEHTLRLVERVVLEYHSGDLLEQARTLLHRHGFAEVLQVGVDSSQGLGILYAKKLVQAA